MLQIGDLNLGATLNSHYFTPTQSIFGFKNVDGFLRRSGKKMPIFEFLFSQSNQNNSTDWESRKFQNLSWGLIFFVCNSSQGQHLHFEMRILKSSGVGFRLAGS